ncbi:MAG: YkgJ family cysteine cluster protein [Nitrospirae bacterium]|nr:YkgJ family cysteine cluster protein [Nitrospirota bacterium]MBF0535212.1 YkgJ family cysteine cluster protein [Nitrospirota bacterium]MBF0615308.1 YkgJ family cysteine cluster protein [Nitrospirota bacterium]
MEIITPGTEQTECKRCGDCCTKGSPTLHVIDQVLLMEGTLNYKDIYTIRSGELVYNNVDDEFITIDEELIKIKEKPDSRECIFFNIDDVSCRIYEKRPAQCQAFECWNTEKFLSVFAEEKMTRETLLQSNPALMDIVETHEMKCSYSVLNNLFEEIRSGKDVVNEVFDILSYDMTIRHMLSDKMGVPNDYMNLLLGRPLNETIIMYGYKVETEEGGFFTLVNI